MFCPRAGLSLQTQHSPLYPLLSPVTPVVNFCEVRTAQLAKSTLLTSTLMPWGFSGFLKVCSDAKERVGAESNGSYPTYSSLVKVQPWVMSLRWKTCLRQNCNFGSCALGQNTDDDDDFCLEYLATPIAFQTIYS